MTPTKAEIEGMIAVAESLTFDDGKIPSWELIPRTDPLTGGGYAEIHTDDGDFFCTDTCIGEFVVQCSPDRIIPILRLALKQLESEER